MKNFEYPDGATPLDPNELSGLKLDYITTREELNRWEQDNINEAINWLEKRRNKKDILNQAFVKKLHKKMFEKVWSWAGSFRQTNKNIGVDKYVIGQELLLFLDDVKYWIENQTYKPDEIGTRFHHRLVLIHPFANGNGRHARLMADTLMTNILEASSFSWGSANLNTQGDVRRQYISALKSADNHDYSSLIEFVRS